MRTTFRLVATLILTVTAVGCSRQHEFELDNRSGQRVAFELPRANGQSATFKDAPSGRVTAGLPIGGIRLQAGTCAYDYGYREMGRAEPRIEEQFFGAPIVTYHVHLEPDFTLRLFNLVDGQVREEVVSAEWPAKPTVECRSTG